MDILNSKDPLGDVNDAQQKGSGNPVDFSMHPTVRMPDVQITTVVKGKESYSSPESGTKLTKAVDDGKTDEDAQAAKNRAYKQGIAGV